MYNKANIKPNFLGLFPFIFFIVLYVGSGVFLQLQGVKMAFYQLPPAVAMFISAFLTFIIFKGNLTKKIHEFIEGCSQYDIIFMCLIFVFIGAFSKLCKEIGGVEAVANLGLRYIPSNLLVSGIFFITFFVAVSTGSFIGSIITITPIAFELAIKGGIPLPLISGAVLGGGALGDNMSLISDTTIISSRTQGTKVKKVFKYSAFYTFSSGILSIIVFVFLSPSNIEKSIKIQSINLFKIIPYFVVMILSFFGLNVFLVIFTGIILAGIIGIYFSDFTFLEMTKIINDGFIGMGDMLLLVIFTGGIAYMSIKHGGFQWLLVKLKNLAKSKRSAEIAIILLISIVTISIANNTIAILMTGGISKEIARNNKINPARSASLLNMLSCVLQGAIPYGAHMILLIGFSEGKISPIDIMPFLIYQLFLSIFIVLSIIEFFKTKRILKFS